MLDSNTKTKPRPYLLEATLHKGAHFPQMTECHSVKSHITITVMNHGSQLAVQTDTIKMIPDPIAPLPYLIRHQGGDGSSNLVVGLGFPLWT